MIGHNSGIMDWKSKNLQNKFLSCLSSYRNTSLHNAGHYLFNGSVHGNRKYTEAKRFLSTELTKNNLNKSCTDSDL